MIHQTQFLKVISKTMKQTFRLLIGACALLCVLTAGCGKKDDVTPSTDTSASEARKKQYTSQAPGLTKKGDQAPAQTK